MGNMRQLKDHGCKSNNTDQHLGRQSIKKVGSFILKLDLIREINLPYDSHKCPDSYVVIYIYIFSSLANTIARGRIT